jgi:translation initiation factor 1
MKNMMAQSPDEIGLNFSDIVARLDREQARVTVRLEARRFGKPATLIEGLRLEKEGLRSLATRMKRKLATGGTVKDNVILLQGDQRIAAARFLVDSGFQQQSIEVA